MKTISRILLITVVMSIVSVASAKSTVKYFPGEPEGDSVEELSDFIIKNITAIDASDASDAEKMNSIAMGIADTMALAGDKTEDLMKMVVDKLKKSDRMQVAVAVAALSGKNSDSIISAIIEQLGGADSVLGKKAKEAADNPSKILGRRLSVSVGRVVSPASSLKGKSAPGITRTLPLPPPAQGEPPVVDKKPAKKDKPAGKYTGQ